MPLDTACRQLAAYGELPPVAIGTELAPPVETDGELVPPVPVEDVFTAFEDPPVASSEGVASLLAEQEIKISIISAITCFILPSMASFPIKFDC